MSTSGGCGRRSRRTPRRRRTSTRSGGSAMSSATSNTPPKPATPHDQYARQIPFRESEIADVGAQLSQITQQAATALTGVRTTFQLFDRPNRLRTVAASGGLDAAMEPAVFANGAGVAGWVAGE